MSPRYFAWKLCNEAGITLTPASKHHAFTLARGKIGMDTSNRHLMWYGMFLFLLGLLTGSVEQRFTNMRMGLAAHLEGVMNGIFLVALGLYGPRRDFLQQQRR
jgi:hypothetical protein